MKNDTKKTGTGTKNAQAALADINAQIEAFDWAHHFESPRELV
jgi:hypothetical protein